MRITIGRNTPDPKNPLVERRPVTIGDKIEAYLTREPDFVWTLKMVDRWTAYDHQPLPTLETAQEFLEAHFGDMIDPNAGRNLRQSTTELRATVEVVRTLLTTERDMYDTLREPLRELLNRAQKVTQDADAVLEAMPEENQ